MTATYQRNILDVSYNGWENYETWNVALWIGNDYGFYKTVLECDDYQDFLNYVSDATPDGVFWNDPKVNVLEVNEMIQELKGE